MKRKPVKKSRPGLWITLMCSPLLVMTLFIVWRISHQEQYAAKYKTERLALERRVEAVSSILAENGATCVLEKNGTLKVTLPHQVAMQMNERQSNELALHLHQKTGTHIRLITPAGQTLVTAP